MKQPSLTRPLIWVKPADRASILAKIASQPWAKAHFTAMQERVKGDVAQHQRDRDAYLRGFPLIPSPAGPQAHPTFAYQGANGARPNQAARGKLMHFAQVAIDCGVLFFLTQDKTYAACAADILNVFTEAMVQLKPSEAVGNGGYLYPNDNLLEARILGAQIPLVYDFVASYLQSGATVYDLATKQPRSFAFEHAQTVFRNYAKVIIEHGLIDCNWPVLEMPCLAHNVLALDDAVERTRLLTHVTHQNTRHQDSLKKIVAQYAQPGDVWPESLQYSGGVSSLSTYLVALMERQGLAATLTSSYANIPLSLARLRELRFPNGENIRFGDGPRKSSQPYDSFEIAYALGQRVGDAKLQALFGGLINLGMESKEYDRAKAEGHSGGANPYFAPLPLLWFVPTISGKLVAPTPKVTDALPFVGAVLQRNLSPDKDPQHALMAVVSGGSHVHGHASGMALELYGAGEVLGANAGKGAYTTDDHENYRRLFAAYNGVIVNGASRSEGGWVNLGINTVQKVALEPAVGALPVSVRHSFSLTTFEDDKSPGAKAKQERLVAIIRTSDKTGYYIDVFRSKAEDPNQFHDYLYHNVGEPAVLRSAKGALKLTDAPGRFVPVSGTTWTPNRSYLFPGWHVFQQAKASAPFSESVTVHFAAPQRRPVPVNMRLFITGAEGREYAHALAPETHDAPAPYDKAPTPVLILRQTGEAWDRPFAVVYEPFAGTVDSGSIRSVSALGDKASFSGFRVVSKLEGRSLNQYVLVLPTPQSTFTDKRLEIEFEGRFAVITLSEKGECTGLYLGEGTRLRYRNLQLSSLSGASTAAAAELNDGSAVLTANSPVELLLPSGKRLISHSIGCV